MSTAEEKADVRPSSKESSVPVLDAVEVGRQEKGQETAQTDLGEGFVEGKEASSSASSTHAGPDAESASSKATKSSKKKSKELKSALQMLEAVMNGGNGPRTVKQWQVFVQKCENEIGPGDHKLMQDAKQKYAERVKAVRDPIERELQDSEDLSLRSLGQLERRIAAELDQETDPLFEIVEKRKSDRISSHKDKLLATFKEMMKGKLEKLSVRKLESFVKSCEAELDDEDPLLNQARSAIEARVSGKVDSSKAKAVGKRKRDKKSSKRSKDDDGEIAIDVKAVSPASKKSQEAAVDGPIRAVLKGNDDSSGTKLVYLVFFCVFAYILVSYLKLVAVVAPIGDGFGDINDAGTDAAATGSGNAASAAANAAADAGTDDR